MSLSATKPNIIKSCVSFCLQILAVTGVALALNGCAKIINITTSEPIQINPSKRTFGTKLDDNHLETITRVNLMKAAPEFDDTHINIDCYNGILLLTGQVPTAELRQLAGATAGKINTVRSVHNELSVKAPTSFGERSYDTWLSTKISAKFLADGDTNSSHVRIIVEDKSVFLMGLVSRHEAEKVTNLVSSTQGLRQVVKVFEYLD